MCLIAWEGFLDWHKNDVGLCDDHSHSPSGHEAKIVNVLCVGVLLVSRLQV